MPRQGWLVALLLVLLISAGSVAAQDAVPDAVQPEGTPTFGAITLQGNFVLDPFVVSVIGGGLFPASDLSEDCPGFVPANPTLGLTLSGDPTENLRIFTYSDKDPVLVVKTPSGEFLCSDDTSSRVVDPTVEIASAEAGDYAIWVGAYAENQLVPAFLVVSHSPEVTAALFDVGTLVARVPVGDVEANLAAQLEAGLRQIAGAALTATLDPAAEPQVFEGASGGGEILAFQTDARGFQCAGFVSAQPTLDLTVPEGAPALAALFESTADSTLVIVSPDGRVFCNDDVLSGNLNPGIIIPNPPAGTFGIYVGAFDPAAPATGRLIVSGSGDVAQAILAAATPEAGQ